MEEFVARLGTNEKAANRLPKREYPAELKANLPKSFDARTNWPVCFPPVRDQGQCGSCWAHGAVESLSWRQCISGIVPSAMQLAPQWLVDCDRGNNGCNGGQLPSAWSFMSVFGVADETCRPYKAVDQHCTNLCDDGSNPKLYYAAGASTFGVNDIESAMVEIMTNGPIEAAFSVYQDFYDYEGGIYQYSYGDYLGGHAVMVVGWGEEDGVKYWIVQNSWGADWAEDGYFRIVRGINDCGFEGQFTAGPAGKTAYIPPIPQLPSQYYTVFSQQELGVKEGIALWLKDNGNTFRLEAYTPGTKVIETGYAGVKGHFSEYAIQGTSTTCICGDQAISNQNVFQPPSTAKFSKNYWSGEGSDKSLMEFILTDYVLETKTEKVIWTFADAAINRVATPWKLVETVIGIEAVVDVVIFDPTTEMTDSMFADACDCSNRAKE